MTTSTSPTSSGSSADVTSSKSITCGLHHQRPRDRDSLLLTARELVRMLLGLLRRARRIASSSWARFSASPRGILRMRRAASVRLSSAVRCGKRLNCWKTIPIRCLIAETSTPLRGDLLALEEDPAGLDRLEQVDAAEQRALAASARPDDAQHLAGLDAQVDAVEDEVVAEPLVDVLHADHGDTVCLPPFDGCGRNAHCPEGSNANVSVRSSGLTHCGAGRTLPKSTSSERR